MQHCFECSLPQVFKKCPDSESCLFLVIWHVAEAGFWHKVRIGLCSAFDVILCPINSPYVYVCEEGINKVNMFGFMLQLHKLKDQTLDLIASWHLDGATAGGVCLPDWTGVCEHRTVHFILHSSYLNALNFLLSSSL